MFAPRRHLVAASAIALLAGLPACGGGSGAGDFSIQLDRTSVSLVGDEGTTAMATLTATVHGTPSGTLYVGVTSSDPGIGDYQVGGTETSASILLYSDTTLPAGTYTGHLQLWVCADENCDQPVGGSPFTVAFTVVLHKILKVSPGTLDLTAQSGSGTSADVAVQLPDGVTDYTVTVPAWASATKTAQGFRLALGSLPAGDYFAWLTITAGASSASVTLNYTVTAPPGGQHGLSVSPGSLTFSATEGARSATQALAVTPPTWHPAVDAAVQESDATWLVLARTATGFDVYADASGLAAGTYQAHVVVAATGDAYSSPQTVPVAFTVGAGLVRPGDRILQVTSGSTTADLQGSAPVAMAGGPDRPWTAQSDSAWLVLDQASGQTGQSVTYHVAAATVAAMAPGSAQVATITLQAQPSTITPAQFTVTITRHLPEVRFASPSALVAGQAVRLIVRGRDFPLDAASHLAIAGVTGAVATRVSDTELRVDLTAGAVGSHVVSLPNALGIATATARFDVVAPATLEYHAVSSAGYKHGLTWDPVSQTLYVANVAQGAVLQLQRAGGAWTPAVHPVAALSDVGLMPDRSALVTASSDGTLRLLDPASLAVGTTYARGAGFLAYYSQDGMAITNDGRAWLGFGSGWGTLGTCDLLTGDFAAADMNGIQSSMYGGPWFSLSRDGERLVMVQSAQISPVPPLLYLDAADGAPHPVPGSGGLADTLGYFVHASQSEDGSRIALDAQLVLDGSFAAVGRLTLPGYSWSHAAALSPDGTRAYAFEANETNPTRFWVFDTSQAPASGSDLPLLGYFDVADDPSCVGSTCDYWPEVTIAPDGRTLFVAGYGQVLVVPVPDTLQPWPAPAAAQALSTRASAARVTATPVNGGTTAWRPGAGR